MSAETPKKITIKTTKPDESICLLSDHVSGYHCPFHHQYQRRKKETNMDEIFENDLLTHMAEHDQICVADESGNQIIVPVERYVGTPVIHKTLCLTPKQTKEFKCDKPWAHINMRFWHEDADPHEVARIYFGYNLSADNNFDTLKFCVTGAREFAGPNPFSEHHASLIKKFLDKNWEKIDVLLITHAFLNVSLGVARAICEFYGYGSKEPKCAPGNEHVYKVLLNELLKCEEK